MFSKIILGERIRQSRKEKQLTLEQLGLIINLKKGSLSDVENGKTAVSIEVLYALADYFGVTTDYLLGRTDETR